MRIAICGVSGFVGTHLSRFLVSIGYEVVRIGREHLKHIPTLLESLDGCDVVVNLSGALITKRWSEEYKNELYESRIDTTKKLVDNIERLEVRPKAFVSASAIGIYKENMTHDESSEDFGTNYLSLLVKDWEREAKRAEWLGIRTVILRLGVVLGHDGGAYKEMNQIFSMGLGGIVGNGKQPFSWIHVDDVLNICARAIEDAKMQGIYNLVAPEVVNMKTFATSFGKSINRPVWLPIPEAMIKIRYGEGAEALLKGSTVVPKRLEEEGYEFVFDDLTNALNSLSTIK